MFDVWPAFRWKTHIFTSSIHSQIWKCFLCTALPKFCASKAQHRINSLCKKFSSNTYWLATVHLLQTEYRQTNRQQTRTRTKEPAGHLSLHPNGRPKKNAAFAEFLTSMKILSAFLLCGHLHRPHYRICPSVCLSVCLSWTDRTRACIFLRRAIISACRFDQPVRAKDDIITIYV